jgi:hypothetical protein
MEFKTVANKLARELPVGPFLLIFPITLDMIRRCRIMEDMRTVAETAVFEKYAAEIWSEGDR